MGLAEEWLAVRKTKTESTKLFKELQAKLLAEMGGKPDEVSFGGSTFKLTPVGQERLKYDETACIELLTPAQRKRLTVVSLDVEAFTAAIKSKELDYKTFAPHRTVKAGEGYIYVTVKS
jgi:hypothetical protein